MKDHIASMSETIGVTEKRNLLEVTNGIMNILTHEEYSKIMLVCKECVDRVLQENGLE